MWSQVHLYLGTEIVDDKFPYDGCWHLWIMYCIEQENFCGFCPSCHILIILYCCNDIIIIHAWALKSSHLSQFVHNKYSVNIFTIMIVLLANTG